MKAIEKRAIIENLGYKIENGFDPKTGRDFIRVSKMDTRTGDLVFEKFFKTIHTAYKSLLS